MDAIEFEVVGKAVSQGSTRSVPMRNRGGGLLMKDGRPVLRPVHQNAEKLLAWRQEVAQAARKAYSGPLLIGAVRLSLVFFRPRPKGHFGTGRNAGKLKTSAEDYPIQRPDVLKLARAVEDALTGVIWRDDSQVVEYGPWDDHTPGLAKRWGPFRVAVRIESLDGKTEEAF